MGLDSSVLVIGPYDPDFSGAYDYNHAQFRTPEGTMVISHFFLCHTTHSSEELADALGVEIWNFETHHLNTRLDGINYDKLRYLVDEGVYWTEEDVDLFFNMMQSGNYQAYFEPNG